MTQQIIGSDGKLCEVKTYDEYLEYCKAQGIPALITQEDYNTYTWYLNKDVLGRKEVEEIALENLIIAAWKYSRFMNKEHMQFYYAMNEMLWDKWKSLQ